MKGNILVVDDEYNQRMLIADFLVQKGHTVEVAESGSEAISLFKEKNFDLVISDYKMKDINGVEVLRTVKTINPTVGVILISAYGTVETAVEAMKLGAEDFLVKPINLEQLEKFAQRALERSALVRENVELKRRLAEKYQFDTIIGESGTMQEALNLAGRAAKSKATILITGESGTGKGLLANAVHIASDRADGLFVEINCAALSPGVLESELFGHEKGAFTGADRQHIGRFEMADGGTLFIDEVGDIPLEIQVKLLNVLQSGAFMRVGGKTQIKTDVRIVAATHRDLDILIKQGTFREDLFFRLNVVSVNIPPLRERRSDIPLLVEHLVELYAEQNDKIIKGITSEAMDCLVRYHYPGNVRELENAIMRAVVMARDNIIDREDLPVSIRQCGRESSYNVDIDLEASTLPEMIETIEKKAIHQALHLSKGVQTKAAEMLGITERNLRYKLTKYSIESEKYR